MTRKLMPISIAVILLTTIFSLSVSAEILEIDTASPDFKVESYQYNPDNAEKNYWTNIFATTQVTVDAGIEKSQIKRFAASLKVGAENIVGDPPVTFIDGRASLNAVIPFKNTVMLESFSLKFTVDTRRYFFIPYISADGKSWTEAAVGGAAEKVAIAATYGTSGEIDGPGIECYASNPAGRAADNDINVITITLDKPAETKYLKLTFFGNDAGKGNLTVENQWISFNSFKAEGTTVQDVAPTASTEIAATDAVEQAVAPKTGDLSQIIILVIVLSFASAVMLKKKVR